MSFTDFKEIGVDNPGTSIRYGGDDLKGIMQILNGKIIATKRPRIRSEWIWLDHFDIVPPSTTPSSPTEPNATRIFVDPVNFRLKVKKSDDSVIDIENLDIPNTSLQQISDRGKLPLSLLYNDQDNDLGNHFLDIGEIMMPEMPMTGTCRLFCDEDTGELTVMHDDGMMMSLESVGMHTLDSIADINAPAPALNDVLTWNGTE